MGYFHVQTYTLFLTLRQNAALRFCDGDTFCFIVKHSSRQVKGRHNPLPETHHLQMFLYVIGCKNQLLTSQFSPYRLTVTAFPPDLRLAIPIPYATAITTVVNNSEKHRASQMP